MANLAIIPARGGSKRIPKKNLKDFLGKPIISYSIEVALQSGLFDEVMVSTDNMEIAEIALQYGAKVPFMRSNETADDYSTLIDVIDEVSGIYQEQGLLFDYICCLLPTSPFITSSLLNETLNKLKNSDAESIRPIVRFSYPIQRSFKLTNDKVSFMYPEYAKSRSQDLEPAYHDAGMFYWMLAAKGLKGDKRLGVEIPENTCHDIDTDIDWKIAELKYKALYL